MYVSIFWHRSDLAYVDHVNSRLQAEGENPYILLGKINVENTNLVLERTDRIPHRDAQGPRSNEVTDLGRHVMHQVPRESRVARRNIILYDLRHTQFISFHAQPPSKPCKCLGVWTRTNTPA